MRTWTKLGVKHTLAIIHMVVKYRYCNDSVDGMQIKVDYNKVARKITIKIELNV